MVAILLLLTTTLPIFATAIPQPSLPLRPAPSPPPPSSNLSALNGGPYCTTDEAWRTPNFDREDCLAASERFIYSDWQSKPLTRYEFHSRTTPRRTRFPPQLAPRRYNIASCTVIIALLWNFPQDPPLPPLPGHEDVGLVPKTDVLSFQAVFDALRRISVTCADTSYTGWEKLGQEGAAGLFIMAAGSDVEIDIPVGVEPGGAALNFTPGIGGKVLAES